MAIFKSILYVCQRVTHPFCAGHWSVTALQPSDEEDLAVARLGAPEGALCVVAEEGNVQALGLGADWNPAGSYRHQLKIGDITWCNQQIWGINGFVFSGSKNCFFDCFPRLRYCFWSAKQVSPGNTIMRLMRIGILYSGYIMGVVDGDKYMLRWATELVE